MSANRPTPLDSHTTVDGTVNLKTREGGDSDDDALVSGFAPFNTRATAAVIDCMVSFGITITLSWLLPGFASKLAWLTGMAYLIVRDSLPFLGGQSVGKKAMKIKVVTLDDKSLSGNWEAAVIRNLILVIPLMGLVEVFILLTREDKPERGRRLGDEWAKTKVIIAPEPVGDEKPE
ncbi:MAG: RDD family protein [Luteolibacter sp.]